MTETSVERLDLSVPPPTPTSLSMPFWTAANENRLVLHRCAECHRFDAYPREVCSHCWSTSMVWVDASGMAEVVTFTRVHRPGHPGWQELAPYVVGLVRLDEGPVVLTHLVGELTEIHEGQACAVRFTRVGDWTLPFFQIKGAK